MQVTVPDSGRFPIQAANKKYYLCVPYVAGIVGLETEDE